MSLLLIFVPVAASVVFLGVDVAGPDPVASAVPLAAAAPSPDSATRLGIPAVAVDAYAKAAASPDACPGLSWWLLAGIAAIETDHGRYGGAAADLAGNVRPAIYGPRLDGALAGTAVIGDSDQGRLDGDPLFDRAMGPLQHLPSSWRANGRDGNGDGIADPQNLYDAARASAVHLCSSAGGEVGSADRTRRAVFGYNPSNDYVADVLARASVYALPVPGQSPTAGPLVQVHGIMVASPIAPALDAMVQAAKAQGVVLAGSGYRSTADQVLLRQAHCGPTLDDIWRKPSGACAVPTAVPGTSLHEQGLAVDFQDLPGAWAWLAANAGRFGFANTIPSEPWHWSMTGG
ncbi:MAG: hypothetical protein GEV08_20235 [Acidimicrobiia bacterium]|nr:hypothetical protein [Acidimicrobiia bacterium]